MHLKSILNRALAAQVLRLRDAAGGLPDLRRDRRARAMGRRQGAPDDQLPLVPGPVGEAAIPISRWSTRALRSRLAPTKKVAKSLRRHRPLILNWFLALGGISAGVVEGFNGKAKRTTRKAYGFRTPQGIEMALFHVLGRLPEPQCSHRFC